MLKRLPASFASVARTLMRRKGVVGVFWGSDDDGHRHRIRVLVERKLPETDLAATRMIRPTIDGTKTRVVEVGRPCGQALSCKELVRTGEDSRLSTLTSLIRDGDEHYALLCGHGTLPIDDDGLVTDYPPTEDGHVVRLFDVQSEVTFRAKLRAGRMTAIQDWTIARARVPAGDINLVSPVTGTYRPRLRTNALATGESVRHYSCLDRIEVHGTVRGYGRVRLRMHDGEKYLYSSTFEVRGDDRLFSRKGDSGSLVVDEHDRAVGVVLGGLGPETDPATRTAVLPFVSPSGVVIPKLHHFFS